MSINTMDTIETVNMLVKLGLKLTDIEVLEGKSYKAKVYFYSFLFSIVPFIITIVFFSLAYFQYDDAVNNMMSILIGTLFIGYILFSLVFMLRDQNIQDVATIKYNKFYKKIKKISKKDAKTIVNFRRFSQIKTIVVFFSIFMGGYLYVTFNDMDYALVYAIVISFLLSSIYYTIALNYFDFENRVSIKLIKSYSGLHYSKAESIYLSKMHGTIYSLGDNEYLVFDENSGRWNHVKICRDNTISRVKKLKDKYFD